MKKFFKALFFFILIIIFVFLISISVDYFRYKEYKKPIFAFFPITYLDGGTREYWGLGYKIIYFNLIEDNYWGQKAEIKYMGPIWTDFDIAYKKATQETYGKVFSTLSGITEKGVYSVLIKHYSIEETEKIFSYKENDELKYYFKLFEVYNNGKLNEEEKKLLMYDIEDYYSRKKDSMKKEAKGKFDLFLYGFDYTKID